MGDSSNITITISPDSVTVLDTSEWLHLEQKPFPDSANQVDSTDVIRMTSYVRAGYSAFSAVTGRCPWATINSEAVVTITLPFYVWLSDMNMPYTLSSSIGEITDASVLELESEFTIIVDDSDLVDLGFLFDGSVSPESPCFTPEGVVRDVPDYSISKGRIGFQETIVCVFRASGIKKGYRHSLVIEIKRTDDTGDLLKITGVNPVVRAVYHDGGKTRVEQLTIELPECAKSFLEKCGESGMPEVFLNVPEPPEDNRRIPVQFYNVCTGKLLRTSPMYLTLDEINRLKEHE